MEDQTLVQSLQQRLANLFCTILSSLGIYLWLLQSKALFIGSWTLPFGLFSTQFNILILLSCIWGYVFYARRYYLYLSVFQLYVLFQDFYFSPHKEPQEDQIAVISWNVAGKDAKTPFQEEKLPCLIGYLDHWKKQNKRQILFLQEVPKYHEKKLESALGLQCFWAHYLCQKENCNGLLLCADSDWKLNLKRQKQYTSDEQYGFLQLELEDKQSKQKLNALNLHLESLYRTISKFPNLKKNASVTKMLLDNPDPKLLFRALEQHAINQRSEIDELFDVLRQLQDPILLGGDFNSPPSLWFHRNLRNLYQDSFQYTGNGFGYTTNRFGFLQGRVDYLYASPELTWVHNSNVDQTASCSDHYPLLSYLSLSDGTEE